jgi:hypothetical protein
MNDQALSLGDMLKQGTVGLSTDEWAKIRKELPRTDSRSDSIVYDEAFLLRVADGELYLTGATALLLDETDKNFYREQVKFKLAFSRFQEALEILSEPLKTHLQLPADYVRRIEESPLLSYAVEKSPGRPPDWKRDELYLRLLCLYKMLSGKFPAVSDNGPTVRFMRAAICILRQRLSTVKDKESKGYAQIKALWHLPTHNSFLKGWFDKMGGRLEIQRQIIAMIDQHQTTYGGTDRHSAHAPSVDRG